VRDVFTCEFCDHDAVTLRPSGVMSCEYCGAEPTYENKTSTSIVPIGARHFWAMSQAAQIQVCGASSSPSDKEYAAGDCGPLWGREA
jgi:transcription elongation factor Elf1